MNYFIDFHHSQQYVNIGMTQKLNSLSFALSLSIFERQMLISLLNMFQANGMQLLNGQWLPLLAQEAKALFYKEIDKISKYLFPMAYSGQLYHTHFS